MASPPIIVTIDSSGAQRGAEDARTAIQKIISANAALQASASNTAEAISKAEIRKQQLLDAGGKLAMQAAAEIQRAADLGAAAYNKLGNAITGNSRDISFLDRLSKSFDPFIGASQRAQKELEGLLSIAQKGSAQSAQAGSMVAEAARRMNEANANLAAGFNVASETTRLTAKFAPLQEAARKTAMELADLQRAAKLNITIDGGYEAAFDRIANGARRAQESLAGLAAVQEQVGSTRNNTLGGSMVDYSQGLASQSAYNSRGQGIASAFNDADKERMSIDSVYAASKRYEEQLKSLDNQLATGNINQARHSVLLDEVNKRYADSTGTAKALGLAEDGLAKSATGAAASHGQMQFAARQAQVQTIQLFSSIATGQPIWMALIQQGHQVADVMAATGTGFGAFGEAAKKAWALVITPAGLAVTAVAAMAALGYAAESSARRIGTLRNELSLVRTDFGTASAAADEAAKHLAANSSLSTSDARAGINSVFSQGNLFTGTKAQAEELVLVNARLSKALGETAINAQRAGQIVADPAGVLQTLLKEHPDITAFNQQTVDTVRHLQDIGKQGDALVVAYDALRRVTVNVKDATTPLAKAWQDLEKSITSANQGGKSLAEMLGGPIVGALTAVLNGVNSLVAALKELERIQPGSALQAIMTLQFGPALGPSLGGALGLGRFASGASGSGSAASYANIGSPGEMAAPKYDVEQMALIVQKFVESGTKLDDAVAYAANAMRESGGNFKSVNMGDAPGGSHGMFQWNKERLVNFQNQNQGLLPEQTSIDAQIKFANWERANGYSGVDQAVRGKTDLGAKAATVTAGFEVPKDIPGQSAISAAIARDFMVRFNGGSVPASPMAGAVGASSGDLTDARVMERAKPLFDSSVEQQRLKAIEDIKTAEAALQLPNLDDAHVKAYGDALDDAKKRLYEAVTASQALERSTGIQITAEQRMINAWDKGAVAASNEGIRLKAEADARQIYGQNTAQAAAFADRMTAALTKQAAAEQAVQAAQQRSGLRNQIDLTREMDRTLGMEETARAVLIDRMRAEQQLKERFPQLTQAEIDKNLALVEANTRVGESYKQHQANLQEAAGFMENTFSTLGTSFVDAFYNGQSAAKSFQDTMTNISKAILNEFLKLAVINPLLNNMFGGNRPTAFGAGGVLDWIGGGGNTTTGSSLTANDKAGIDLPTPPIPPGEANFAHSGWLVGAAPPVTGYVHPAYFDDAPRFHTGTTGRLNLAHDEFPAVLQKGERVLTEKQDDRVLELIGKLTATVAGKNPALIDTQNLSKMDHDKFFDILNKGEEIASARKYHAGGLVGSGGVPTDLSAAMFVGAPRFHDGMVEGQSYGSTDWPQEKKKDEQFTGTSAVGSAAASALAIAQMIMNLTKASKAGTTGGLTGFFDKIGSGISEAWNSVFGATTSAASSALTAATSFGIDAASAATFAAQDAAITAGTLAVDTTSTFASTIGEVALAGAHTGWHVGMEPPPETRFVHAPSFDTLPRFHQGLGGDEFMGILQKGERVITERQQGQIKAATASEKGDAATTNNFTFHLPGIKDQRTAETFQRSMPHIMRQALDEQLRSKSRNG
jgi:hypothetical protein